MCTGFGRKNLGSSSWRSMGLNAIKNRFLRFILAPLGSLCHGLKIKIKQSTVSISYGWADSVFIKKSNIPVDSRGPIPSRLLDQMLKTTRLPKWFPADGRTNRHGVEDRCPMKETEKASDIYPTVEFPTLLSLFCWFRWMLGGNKPFLTLKSGKTWEWYRLWLFK